jgi:hypothetical protein
MTHWKATLLAAALLLASPAAWAQVIDDAPGTVGRALMPTACFVTSDTADSGDFAVPKCNTNREPVIDSEMPAAAALGDNAANPTAPAVGAFGMLWDGAAWDRAPGTSAGGALVDLGANNDVTATNATASNFNAEAQGDAAHDAAVSGNPVLGGFEARTTDGTPVSTAGDAVRGMADTLGKQVVLLGAVHDRQVRGTITEADDTADDIIAAAGAGVRIAVMSCLVTNAHATVGTKVEIRDGTTVKIQGYAAAVGGVWAMDGGGVPLFISTANTAVTGRNVTTGSDTDITCSGYTIAN